MGVLQVLGEAIRGIRFPELDPVSAGIGNFAPIPAPEETLRVAYVDGGNGVIVETPTASVSLVRGYLAVYEGTKKAHYERHDIVVVMWDEGSLVRANLYPLGEEVMDSEVYITLKELENDALRTNAARASLAVRRYMEWLLVERGARLADVVVKDGALQTSGGGEEEYAERAIDAFGDGKYLVGFSKSSTLKAPPGIPLNVGLERLARKLGVPAPWAVEVDVPEGKERIRSRTFVGRFHPRAERAFRVDVMGENHMVALSALLPFCADPFLLGYPYGLLDADAMARVREEEVRFLRNAAMGMADEDLRAAAWQMDAHDVISRMR